MANKLSVAFIGTGIMGAPIAGHILDAGYPVTVNNRTKSKATALIERGAVWADTPADAVANADVVFTMVGYPCLLYTSLFLGAPGAGKLDAAWALAQAFLCEQGGCGSCDSCVRVARHTHPDVHYYTPESATGYLIAQTRELLDDVPLAPIRAKAKVYIIDQIGRAHV